MQLTQIINSRHFNWFLILIFFSLAWLGILHHEMWGDELGPWIIARDSASFLDVIREVKRQHPGHASLWYLLLHILTQWVSNPLGMQVLHIIFSTLTVALIICFSPFQKAHRIMLSFGYFFLYEYSVISRNYIQGVFFIFLICCLYQHRRKHYLLLSILLFLIANFHVYATAIAIAIGATLILEYCLWMKSQQFPDFRKTIVSDITALVIITSGIVVSLLQTILFTDPSLYSGSRGGDQGVDINWIILVVSTIWKSYAPMPGISYQFWNTNIIDDFTALIPSLALLLFSIAIFYRKPIILFLYTIGTLELLLITFFRPGSARHWGYLFIQFLTCLWLSKYYQDIKISGLIQPVSKFLRYFDRHQKPILTTLFSIQLVAGIFAYSVDLVSPFSGSWQSANVIKNRPDQSLLLLEGSGLSPTLTSYLNEKTHPFREGKWTGRSFVWIGPSQVDPTQPGNSQLFQEAGCVLVASRFPLNDPRMETWDVQLREFAKFDRSIVGSENYYLYEVERSQGRCLN